MHTEDIGDSTISVECTHPLPFETDAGPGHAYKITVDTPSFQKSASIGLGSGEVGVVRPLTWSVVVRNTVLEGPPGSKDNAPLQQAQVRDWVAENRDELEARCDALEEG